MIALIIFSIFTILSIIPGETAQPDYTDYCRMLARDIKGKKTGFMAGNCMMYLGGQSGPDWEIWEEETIGLTHSFFYDGRCRGRGIVTTPNTGTGHDFQGWEFYRDTRIAYGRVISGDTIYNTPKPTVILWQPDRITYHYQLGEISIVERKFVSLNDVVTTIITSSQPIEIEFWGQTFICNKSVKVGGSVTYLKDQNALHISEDGTVMCEPERGMEVEGRLMYSGLNSILAFSRNPLGKVKIEGQTKYTFRLPCDQTGLIISHTMNDDYNLALKWAKHTVESPEKELTRKTKYINDLLNQQIPYFRCSDPVVTRTYYYLWSLYFLYHRYVPQGFTKHPYTVTAVNNFQSAFAFDHWVYTHLGSWVTDKDKWGMGNTLIWKEMLPFVDPKKGVANALPETFGTTWCSPLNVQKIHGHVEATWNILSAAMIEITWPRFMPFIEASIASSWTVNTAWELKWLEL